MYSIRAVVKGNFFSLKNLRDRLYDEYFLIDEDILTSLEIEGFYNCTLYFSAEVTNPTSYKKIIQNASTDYDIREKELS